MYNYGPGKAWKTPGIFFSYFVVMKRHKAPGLSGLTAEMIQATEGIGTQWLLDLCNGIVKEGCIPEDWKSSVILPIYKGKGAPMQCGTCRGIML